MSEQENKAPHAVAKTTPPSGTFHEVKVKQGSGELMYWPEQNGFIALFADEYREFWAEADDHSRKIETLQNANRKFTAAALSLREAHKSAVAEDIKKAEAALETAKNEMHLASAEVKKKLEPLSNMDAKSGVKMVELVPLRTPKYKEKAVPIYVKSTMLTKVLAEKRIHLLSGEKAKREKEKVFKDGKLNVDEIKKRITDNAQDKGFKKEWKIKPDNADAYTGVLNEWATTMNGDIATFLEREVADVNKEHNLNPKDARRNVDLSADAQLLRYTAGAGLEVNFKPFKGNLDDKRDGSLYKRAKRVLNSGEIGIKANANASFAIAEGRVQADLYFPHCAGYHALWPVETGLTFDLGYWRFFGSVMLTGSAGASVAVELDIAISYTGGKQGIKGIPAAHKDKRAVKARTGAAAELNVYGGVRAGIDLTGALQWLNPEGARSGVQTAKLKPGQAVAEFKDMAKVSAGVAGSLGYGFTGAFKVAHEDGKFVIYAKLGPCIGLGGDATCRFEATEETIGEFFKCVAYQLKRADFHKQTDAIDVDAYRAFMLVSYIVVATNRALVEFVYLELEEIYRQFEATLNRVKSAITDTGASALDFVSRMRKELEQRGAGWISYAPPEVMGLLLYQINEGRRAGNPVFESMAAKLVAMAVEAPQTLNHLNTVAERMTSTIGDKQPLAMGLSMLQECVDGTVFRDSIDEATRRLAIAQPVNSAPFIWNNEPEFVVANLAIEHPMYA